MREEPYIERKSMVTCPGGKAKEQEVGDREGIRSARDGKGREMIGGDRVFVLTVATLTALQRRRKEHPRAQRLSVARKRLFPQAGCCHASPAGAAGKIEALLVPILSYSFGGKRVTE